MLRSIYGIRFDSCQEYGTAILATVEAPYSISSASFARRVRKNITCRAAFYVGNLMFLRPVLRTHACLSFGHETVQAAWALPNIHVLNMQRQVKGTAELRPSKKPRSELKRTFSKPAACIRCQPPAEKLFCGEGSPVACRLGKTLRVPA